MKNYLVEAVGSFFLTLALVLTGNALAVGLVLLALVYSGRHVSGAYYNPALALAAWLRGALRRDALVPVVGAQVLGSLVAFLLASFGGVSQWSPSVSGAGVNWWPFAAEVLMAYLLASLILTLYTATQEKNNDVYGLAHGLAYAGVLSLGALANPALPVGYWVVGLITRNGVSNIGPFLVVLVAAPLIGAALAAYGYAYHYGRNK